VNSWANHWLYLTEVLASLECPFSYILSIPLARDRRRTLGGENALRHPNGKWDGRDSFDFVAGSLCEPATALKMTE
jgi:hypothetical protein